MCSQDFTFSPPSSTPPSLSPRCELYYRLSLSFLSRRGREENCESEKRQPSIKREKGGGGARNRAPPSIALFSLLEFLFLRFFGARRKWRCLGGETWAPPSALRTIAANLRNTPLRLRLQIKQRIPPHPPAAAAAAAVSDDVSLVFLPLHPFPLKSW